MSSDNTFFYLVTIQGNISIAPKTILFQDFDNIQRYFGRDGDTITVQRLVCIDAKQKGISVDEFKSTQSAFKEPTSDDKEKRDPTHNPFHYNPADALKTSESE